MPNSEISNLEVRETIASLPPFIKKWSTILVAAMLFLCLLLTQLIKYKSIISFPVDINLSNNLPPGNLTGLTLNGIITNDQKNQILNSRQCTLQFYNAQTVFTGKILNVTPANKDNQYLISFAFNTPQDLKELKKFNGAVSGSVQVINVDETVLKKIIANYIH